jgi:hypothetical protein
MQTQGIFLNSQERNMVGSFGTKLRKTQKLELKVRPIYKTKKKVIIASWNQNGARTMMHSQLLEGPKCGSQVEDSGKGKESGHTLNFQH